MFIAVLCLQIKTWIQMMVPKIEDGNNFGVSIQEDVLGEVGKSEADAGSYLEQLSRCVRLCITQSEATKQLAPNRNHQLINYF